VVALTRFVAIANRIWFVPSGIVTGEGIVTRDELAESATRRTERPS
jgi:hypothetical protein